MHVREYLSALFAHWWTKMGCALFTLLGFGFLWFNVNNRIALSVTFGAAVSDPLNIFLSGME